MSDDQQEKLDPSKYWTVLPDSNDWTLNIVDPDGFHGAYIKGDGCVHIWHYGTTKEDMSKPDPTRAWYSEDQYIDEDADYEHICDIDAEITRLIALRETAIRHFEQHGSPTAREEWYYGKPMPVIDTTPPRSSEEQRAIFDGFEAERYQQRVMNS